MNKLYQAQLAVQASTAANEQFRKLLEFLAMQAPGIALTDSKSGAGQASVSILGWPYLVESHLTKIADGPYEAKVSLLRQERDRTFSECHSIFVDQLGNFAIGSSSSAKMQNLNFDKDLRVVAADYILVEADRLCPAPAAETR